MDTTDTLAPLSDGYYWFDGRTCFEILRNEAFNCPVRVRGERVVVVDQPFVFYRIIDMDGTFVPLVSPASLSRERDKCYCDCDACKYCEQLLEPTHD